MGFKDQAHLNRWAHEVETEITALKGSEWASKFNGGQSNDRALDELGNHLKAQALGGMRPETRARLSGTVDRAKAEKFSDTIRKADLGSPLYSDAVSGSYLVPVDYMAEVQRVADLESTFKSRVRIVPMGARTMTVPKESTSLTLSWNTAQSSANTEVLPTFGTETLTAYNLSGWIGITESLLEDSAVELGRYFSEVWGQKYGLAIDEAILNATSIPAAGLFTSASPATTVTMSTSSHTNMDADDLLAMIEELSGAQRKGSVFVMSAPVFDIVRGLRDATGRYIVDLLAGPIPTVFGYPVLLCDSAPATAAAGARFVFFGNPRRILLGMRKDLEVKFYPDTAYNVEYDQVFWRARARFGLVYPTASALVVLRTAA